jgi:hypothetical protein
MPKSRVRLVHNLSNMKKAAGLMHEELLELIHTLSDTDTGSDRSLVCEQFMSGIFLKLRTRYLWVSMN